jgi:hypothetical protein
LATVAEVTRRTLPLLGIAGLVLLPLAQASTRTALGAAWRAFRDPSLLDRPAPQAASPPPACARFDESRGFDAELQPTLDKVVDLDLDDPDGAALKTLVMPDLRVPITRRTMRYVRFFTKGEEGRRAFLDRFRRGARYRPVIEHALREAGLPEDLVWLAAVESGFEPTAVSQAGAAGLFQFMPETGQLYGLEISSFVDERRSIGRATAAAVTHLRDLYERFHRWDLALAAYNAGFDRVVSAVERVNKARSELGADGAPKDPLGHPVGFADLAAARALPTETCNYVPQIAAYAIVAANRARFGLDAPDLAQEAPLDGAEIAVPQGTKLRTIARATSVSIDVLREHNPQLLRDRVPTTGGDYLITVPADRVARALATLPSYLEQEVLADATEDEASSADAVAIAVSDDDDDRLPRRPRHLGRNRLPAFDAPFDAASSSRPPSHVALDGNAMPAMSPWGSDLLTARLPVVAVGLDIGWRGVRADTVFSGLSGDVSPSVGGARGKSSAIDKAIDALGLAAPEPLRAVQLPNGVMLRLRRDAGAAITSITTRLAVDPPLTGPGGAPLRASFARDTDEITHTIAVPSSDVDAALELACARLGVAWSEASSSHLVELRRRASAPRRKALEEGAKGKAWLALGDALFHDDGTVIGAREDPDTARDVLLVEVLGHERARAHASLTVIGAIDEAKVKRLSEALLAPIGRFGATSTAAANSESRERRFPIDVAATHALYGWITPGEGETSDASLRVALSILGDEKARGAGYKTPLQRAVSAKSRGATAGASIYPGDPAGAAVVELAAASPRELAEVESAVDAMIEELAKEGPNADDVAVAKAVLKARLEKLAKAAKQAVPVGHEVHSAPLPRVWLTVHPEAADTLLAALDKVTVETVRAAIDKHLKKDRRVAVTFAGER